MNRSNDIYRQRINRVIDYLNDNLDRTVSLEELASVAFFSPFHFHRIFVAMMGETLNSFTGRMRNEKAARQLRFSGKPIAQIAIECGFSSAATLSRSFGQYFGVSPGRYRKGGEIKNSKIRKDLQPINQYHCSMSEQELKDRFPVELRQLPARRIAYIRVADAFRKGVVVAAFARLVDWSKEAGLYGGQTIFGMSKDDPEVTPREKYTYEACITLPDGFRAVPGSPIMTKLLPACRYAFTRVAGDIDLVAAGINYLFDSWLINSSYECETQAGLEVFRDKDNICNWDYFDLDIGIPVRSIRNFS